MVKVGRFVCWLVHGVLDFPSFSCFFVNHDHMQVTKTSQQLHQVLIAGVDSALETTRGHLLIVVVFILVIVAAVQLGGGVGDDTVGRGVEQASSLLGHQQGRGVLNAAAFLHIVHLRWAGRDGGNTLSKHKQTSTTQRAAADHFLSRGIFVFNHLALRQRQKAQWSGRRSFDKRTNPVKHVIGRHSSTPGWKMGFSVFFQCFGKGQRSKNKDVKANKPPTPTINNLTFAIWSPELSVSVFCDVGQCLIWFLFS